MPECKVSVVMPVHNGERYLAEAVESILGQTYGDFEFVVVDDGSTDGTGEMLDRYAARDRRVKVVREGRRGVAGALNLGVARSSGELIARMDGDDVAMPGRFEAQVRYMGEHPECVLLGSRVLLIDAEGLPIREWCGEATHEEIDRAHLEWGWPVVHPAVMMRRAAVERVGGYREQYSSMEDLDLFLRLAEVGRVCNLPEVLLKYRKHLGAVSHEQGDRQERLKGEVLREAYERRGMDVSKLRSPVVKAWKAPEQHRLWGWWALQAGYLRTARKHAAAAVRGMPGSVESWRLMYCAMRGR